MSLFTRDSGGGTTIISRHPREGLTWYWSLSWQPAKGDFARHWFKLDLAQPAHQRHHCLHLFRRGCLMLSTQDYHKRKAA